MELTSCPECGDVAEVTWRCLVDSTDGPIEHVKILCVRRHWFLQPACPACGPEGWVSSSWCCGPEATTLDPSARPLGEQRWT